MRNRRAAGYRSYGSTKGTWMIAVQAFFAVVGGGIGAGTIANLIAELGGLTALVLYIIGGFFSVAMMLVCLRKSWPLSAMILGMFCLMLLWGLNKTARLDILTGATLLADGAHRLLLLGSVILSAAVGLWMLVVFSWSTNKPPWLPVIVITVLMIYPSTSNSLKAINVAADRTVTSVTVAIATETRSEDRLLSAGKFSSIYEHIHYATIAENALIVEGTEVKVGRELYSNLQPGDQVNIILHSGALGVPWIEVAPTGS